jgi:hypothetical protein
VYTTKKTVCCGGLAIKRGIFLKEVFMSYWRKKKKAIELCHLRKNKFIIFI